MLLNLTGQLASVLLSISFGTGCLLDGEKFFNIVPELRGFSISLRRDDTIMIRLWEAKAGGSGGQEIKTNLVNMVKPRLY